MANVDCFGIVQASVPTAPAGQLGPNVEVPAKAVRDVARSPASGWQRTVWVAAATQFVTLLGFGMAVPFMPLYVQELGVTDQAEVTLWSGVLFGAAAIPMALVAPLWGMVADRYGRKLMLVRSMLGGAALIAGMGFVANVWQLLGLRLIQGAMTGSVTAALAVVAATSPASQVGFALSLVGTAVQLGNSVGPGLGGAAVGVLGFRGSFVGAGLLIGVAGLIALFWIRETPVSRGATVRPVGLDDGGSFVGRTIKPFTWPRFRGLLFQQFLTQFALSATYALLPLYIQGMVRPEWLSAESALGLAVTLTAVSGALATPFCGRWVDRHDPRTLLVVALAGTAITLVPQAVIPDVWTFMALRLASGVTIAGVSASLSVLTKTLAPRDREGAAYGATSAAQAFGWGLGPMLGSVLAAAAGIPVLIVVAGVLLGGLSAAVARRVV